MKILPSHVKPAPTLAAVTLAFASSTFAQAKPSPPPPHAAPALAPALTLGVVDEERLAQARSDFPSLAPKVLAVVAAKRKLTLIVSRRGLMWGGSATPNVDVTGDVLALLKGMPGAPSALTGSQAAAAQQALSALDALKIATRIGGLSYADYNERLTNASITFEANLRKVPPSLLRLQLMQAMQKFVDSRTTWTVCLRVAELGDEADSVRLELAHNHWPKQMWPDMDREAEQARQARRAEDFKPLLKAWEDAGKAVEAAEKLLPSQSTP